MTMDLDFCVEELLKDRDFANCLVMWRAAKSAPKAKRSTGPKLLAAVTPTKYNPGIDD